MAESSRNNFLQKQSASHTPMNEPNSIVNRFSNDGSFMEMFKKQMEKKKSSSESAETSLPNTDKESSEAKNNLNSKSAIESSKPNPLRTSVLPMIGKRRGPVKALKTGTVKKVKKDEEKDSANKDAWSKYMDEVQKYKGSMCQDEDKTRPLVK